MRYFRRILALLLLMMCAAACGEEALPHSFPTVQTESVAMDIPGWTENAATRAMLTAYLWQDYCAAYPEEDVSAADLSKSLVALSRSGLASPTDMDPDPRYLQVVISMGSRRLSIFYVPGLNQATWLMETGIYELEIKAMAMENSGMTVWMNDQNYLMVVPES